MTNQQILETAITKSCLACGSGMEKKPKQSYAQWYKQRYCSNKCRGTIKTGLRSTSSGKGNATRHKYWRRRIPEPVACELCREDRRLALSNRSGEYRDVITDWWYLCYQCHAIYDDIAFDIWKKRRRRYGHKGRA